jgi:Zn-dependent M28 family amino/carboxypeptidase
MSARRSLLACVFVLTVAIGLDAQNSSPSRGSGGGGVASIQPAALEEWLTYVASDELQGRQTYTEGLGLAAAYIADHLKEWGVKPGGDNGSYFQTVKVVGVRTTSRSTVTVDVNGTTRTFRDGEGVIFPKRMGGRQTITGDQIEFAGYGLSVPASNHDDYAELDPGGKVIVWLGSQGPKLATAPGFRLLAGRSRAAIERGAIAVVAPQGTLGGFGRGGATPAATPAATPGATPAAAPAAGRQGGGRGAADDGDFTTAQRFDMKVTPEVTARDEFFEFLFSGSDVKYAEIKDLAAKQQPLPKFALEGVTITFDVDADYAITRTRLTRNVVGIVEGSDPKLKDTFVGFSAHYDHSGYREGAIAGRGGQPPANPNDRILNGADDDGSGTVTLMGLARAFQQGAKPKRSLIFIWHAGEESGLLGSRYMADYPVVPLEKIVALLNMDMIGRNRDDKEIEANTVYLVGSDRISSELHELSEAVNAAMAKPLTLDYEFNDPADPQSIYTRSDHYSYAAKGIPIIFYTTGLHPDYHQVSDEVEKIQFDKLARIAQLVFLTGQKVANLDHAPARDNKGPRAGRAGRAVNR